MTTIIHRSALVYHGHNPAPDVASVVIDEIKGRIVVTWDDVMRDRRQRQARILESRRRVDVPRLHRVRVAYFDQTFFGGWQAFIGDHRKGRDAWIDRDRKHLRAVLMAAWPLSLPFGRDEHERFADWKVAFAETFTRGRQDGRPRGSALAWWDGRSGLRPHPKSVAVAAGKPKRPRRRAIAGGAR